MATIQKPVILASGVASYLTVFARIGSGMFDKIFDSSEYGTAKTLSGTSPILVAAVPVSGIRCGSWTNTGGGTVINYGLFKITSSNNYPAAPAAASATGNISVTVVDDHGTHSGTATGTTKYYQNSVIGVQHLTSDTGYSFTGWSVKVTSTTPYASSYKPLTYVSSPTAAPTSANGAYLYSPTASGGSPTVTTSSDNKTSTCEFSNGYTGAVILQLGNNTAFSVTLTANYSQLSTVSVKYYNGSTLLSTQTVYKGEAVDLDDPSPTVTGKTLIGWSTTKGSSTVAYSVHATGVTFTKSTNLYAVFSANPLTITFNPGEGSGGPTSQTVSYGVSFTLSSEVPTPPYSYYDFLYWQDSSSNRYMPGGTYTITENKTLTAVYDRTSQVRAYVVSVGCASTIKTEAATSSLSTYSSGYGGYIGSSSTTPGYIYFTSTYNSATVTADKDGYVFDGWYTVSENQKGIPSATNATVRISTSATITASEIAGSAKYETASKYYICYPKFVSESELRTVSFDANGGDASSVPSSIQFISGRDVTLPDTIPTRGDVEFLGWATSSSATSAQYYPSDTISGLTSNTTLYAIWKKNTLTYDANGGEDEPEPQSFFAGEEISISSQKPTKSGSTFEYWENLLTEDTYNPSDTATFSSDVTLTAIWKNEPKPSPSGGVSDMLAYSKASGDLAYSKRDGCLIYN